MARRQYTVQRKKTGSEESTTSSSFSIPEYSRGMPLPNPVRTNMESRFGHDFSQVRIHHDSEAAESAEAVNARAYTAGPNVVFNQGEFNPSSGSGEQLLAHELAHVVQQSQGPVSGTPVGGGLKVSEPGDSFEVAADAMASQALSGQGGVSGASAGGSGAIMREAKDDEPAEALAAAPEQEELQRAAKDDEPLEALAAPEEEEVQREAKDDEPLEALAAAPEEEEVQREAKDDEPLEALAAAPEEEEVQREAKDDEPLEALAAAPEEEEVQREAKDDEPLEALAAPEEEEVQRAAKDDEPLATIQRRTKDENGGEVAQADMSSAGLDPSLRTQVERSFASDFQDVRLHSGAEGSGLSAQAFARGSELHLGSAGSSSDALSYEQARVLQQRDELKRS